jgi:hypothetical protein
MFPDPGKVPVARHALANFTEELGPYALGTLSFNFVAYREEERVHAAFSGDKWERLVLIKNEYDPDNMFRFNPNIPPSVESS